jgi:hypothetical protein
VVNKIIDGRDMEVVEDYVNRKIVVVEALSSELCYSNALSQEVKELRISSVYCRNISIFRESARPEHQKCL